MIIVKIPSGDYQASQQGLFEVHRCRVMAMLNLYRRLKNEQGK